MGKISARRLMRRQVSQVHDRKLRGAVLNARLAALALSGKGASSSPQPASPELPVATESFVKHHWIAEADYAPTAIHRKILDHGTGGSGDAVIIGAEKALNEEIGERQQEFSALADWLKQKGGTPDLLVFTSRQPYSLETISPNMGTFSRITKHVLYGIARGEGVWLIDRLEGIADTPGAQTPPGFAPITAASGCPLASPSPGTFRRLP